MSKRTPPTHPHAQRQIVALGKRLREARLRRKMSQPMLAGFLREGNGWVLSPAFDVNPNPDKAEHLLTIDGIDASPAPDLLMATAAFYRLKPKEAKNIEQEVRKSLEEWDKKAKSLGLRNSEIDLLRDVIDPKR